MITLARLHVYPVKSCRGVACDEALLTPAGLEYDREWMIVTSAGRFVTQREEPRLALVATALGDGTLTLTAEGAGRLVVPLDFRGNAVAATVWGDRCGAFDQGEPAARWLSELLGRSVRLVRFDPAHTRLSDAAWTRGLAAPNHFSDGFALLAISLASLDDLNARLAVPLPMDRFRPNLVLDGLPAYGEDGLEDLVADRVRLRRAKACTRCSVTTTNQATGRVEGDEPLLTLRSYRWDAALRGVTFGQNLIVVAGAGARLRAGLELRPQAPPAA